MTRVINRFMRSMSMNSSRLTSENALPLRWPTCMGSPTCMCRPSRVDRPWTRAGCTWTTARSSTSARSINPAHNPLSSICPTPRCPDVPEDRRRDPRCRVIRARPCAARRVVDALDHPDRGGADERPHEMTRLTRMCLPHLPVAGADGVRRTGGAFASGNRDARPAGSVEEEHER
jgi:hypothetical protein